MIPVAIFETIVPFLARNPIVFAVERQACPAAYCKGARSSAN